MTNEIVIAKLGNDKILLFRCPFCDRWHRHGTGGEYRINHGHRVAHCIPRFLPKHLRDEHLGFHIVCLDGVAMNERDLHSLLDAMDEIADVVRARALKPRGGPFVCGEQGDPSDPAWARIHQPHVFVAGLDKITSTKIAGRRIDDDGHRPDR